MSGEGAWSSVIVIAVGLECAMKIRGNEEPGSSTMTEHQGANSAFALNYPVKIIWTDECKIPLTLS